MYVVTHNLNNHLQYAIVIDFDVTYATCLHCTLWLESLAGRYGRIAEIMSFGRVYFGG